MYSQPLRVCSSIWALAVLMLFLKFRILTHSARVLDVFSAASRLLIHLGTGRSDAVVKFLYGYANTQPDAG